VIWKSAPYAASLADSSGRVLWGDRASSARRSFPLRSVSGWELRLGEANTGDQGRRFLWYAFVLLLLMMLAFGVAVTLRTARREMELGRLQAEFAAGVTHEFKSPITGIRLLMERIIGGRVNSRSTIQDYYTAVCRETDRLELLVNRLLETHRIQSGQARYHFAPHCMADIAESAISRLRAQADAKRIHLTLETDDAQREADLDCTAIQDSLENLIENAIKYSPPDTSVAVTVEHTAKEVRVTVRDQGAGIDPADLPRIFDRFYRGRRDERQSVRGTGLGLPLVKAVVEGHGGLVEVKSIPGKGSEFCLRIPLREEERYAQSAHRG
jgi:two-component system phosphate regulon sensor histidine kinase PhoR